MAPEGAAHDQWETGDGRRVRRYSPRLCPCFGECPSILVTSGEGAVSQGEIVLSVATGILKSCRNGTGVSIRGEGDIFRATVGTVTEEQIKCYIEAQEDGSGTFQVWDEPPIPTECALDRFIRGLGRL